MLNGTRNFSVLKYTDEVLPVSTLPDMLLVVC